MSTHKRFAVAGASAALLGSALVAGVGVHADTQAGTAVTGCAIRFTANGPVIHANATHKCTGATSLAVATNGDLVITSAPRGAVVSVTAEEDETLSKKGILAGASGGVGRTVVRFYSAKTGVQIPATDKILQDPLANLWMTWVNAS
ncbi:hypothetical protein [Tenggerimyces flavus]|uniref:Secreted protein n=1 Tax=Tenggerimyces flavus TaxID=1708749 RepID=A0ABV7YH30_9ACTN|nr:hypothetical protein [Tenggerimyces flavus]MBM7784730.1 hypothetical protein [Tenggerimyces flavus]